MKHPILILYSLAVTPQPVDDLRTGCPTDLQWWVSPLACGADAFLGCPGMAGEGAYVTDWVIGFPAPGAVPPCSFMPGQMSF